MPRTVYPPLTILLVEDHAGTRRAIEAALQEWSHRVHSAGSAVEALDMLASQPDVQMLITDWVMPEIDGLELCRLVRRLERPRYLHILVLTARTGKENLIEALEAGADTFLPKSFDGAELRAQVRAVQRSAHLEQQLALRLAELEQRVAERTAELEELLAHKELLMREIHHRVRNNLQIVSSLLSMQARVSEDAAPLQECQSRIESIALVHEQLYRTENLNQIALEDYLASLATRLFSSLGGSSRNIELKLDLSSASVGVDQAVALGLILNELVTNSLKHAFPLGRAGVVTVTLTRTEGWLSMRVSDDGVGSQPHHPGGLGLTLVANLVQQLGAEWDEGLVRLRA